ncbi:hypothetical protein JCM3770_001692 [Rhodotorula araucariae]
MSNFLSDFWSNDGGRGKNSFDMDIECAAIIGLKSTRTFFLAVVSSVPADARHRFVWFGKRMRLEVLRVIDT